MPTSIFAFYGRERESVKNQRMSKLCVKIGIMEMTSHLLQGILNFVLGAVMPRTHPERGHHGSVSQPNLPERVVYGSDLDVTHVVVVSVDVVVVVVLSTFPRSASQQIM